MSAQAVFAIAVPVAPAAPQGPAGAADATGFAALLATSAEMDDGAGEASIDLLAPIPAADGESVQAIDNTPSVATIAPFLAPPLPTTPETAAPAAPPAGLSAEAAPDAGGALTASAAPPAAEPSAGAQPPEQAARASAAHPSEHGLHKGLGNNADRTPSDQATPHRDSPSDSAKNSPLPAHGKGPASDTPGAAAAAAPAPPAPPAMRPLAERTSKPADPASSSTGETVAGLMAGPKDRAAGFMTPPAAGLAAEKAMASPGGKSVTPTETSATTAEAPSEAAAALDPARPAETAAALARETSLSGLSRTTIEATSQIAAQILRRLEGRSTRFEMALLPEELGRVDIKLDIDSEGRLAARLAFDNPAAATDLRGRVDELRRQLEDAGFHLAEDAFEFAERDSGSSAFDRGQDARGGSKRAFAAAQRLNAEADAAIPPRWMALSLSPSGVDVKV